MAKPGLLNINTTNTFQNWLDTTNDLVDIMRSEVITASATGDTTGSPGSPLEATLFGSFTVDDLTVKDLLTVDLITPTSGSSEVNFDAPINIQTSDVVVAEFDSTNGARTRYTGPNVNWDVGILSNATNSFTIDAAGVAGINLTLTTNGDLEISGKFIGGLEVPNGKVLDASSADDVLLPPNFGLVPQGGIIMWSGTIANIPSGWALCDGTNGTPDLTGRFVVHADADTGGTYAPGDTGGADSVALSSSEMPSHGHSFSGTTSTDGAHNHDYFWAGVSGGENFPDVDNTSSSSNTTSGPTSTAGAHNHSFSGTTSSAGGGSAHENRPPYYALAYIMKL